MNEHASTDFAAYWARAETLDAYVAKPIEYAPLWRTTVRLAQLSPDSHRRAAAIAADLSLLVLLEDWCGDAMFSVPFAHGIVNANPRLRMRVLPRDANEALMQAHLTEGSRSIPVVIAYDAGGVERGWWGPRPAALQEWVMREGHTLGKAERYKAIRTWYARDRGEQITAELLAMLEQASSQVSTTNPV